MDYEKVRYDRLNQVVKKAIEHTIKKSLMPEQVYKCFPKISSSETGPEALETAIKQIQKYFHATCVKQVDHIFTEREVEKKLDELDEIIQSAQRARSEGTRNNIQVDQLIPEELIDAVLWEAKPDTEKKLAMIHEQLVLDNHELYNNLTELVNEARDLSNGMSQSLEDLTGGVNDENLAEFDDHLKELEQKYGDADNYNRICIH